jgi:pyruvate/2-oxoglutarate dehydrogenase complex dihydrolipoamide dehydrogenase (E3) component
MVRSIVLRGFDQGMATRVKDYMKKHGTRFIDECIPVKFSKNSEDKIVVDYKNTKDDSTYTEEFDTLLLAIGRSPETHRLGLEELGVKLAKSGKILTKDNEQSSVDNIYAIGDCAEGRPELTPPAIMAGKFLSRRLFSNWTENMDYDNIATTVFTPLEYGACGYSEEVALEK